MSTEYPLCIDLDGTLLNSDLLLESAFAQLKQAPLSVLNWPRWLAEGKANLKAEIAKRVELDTETLPYNQELLTFLREQKAQGRTLVLVTASHRQFAEPIADHLGLFDDVLATDGDRNLAGPHKAESAGGTLRRAWFRLRRQRRRRSRGLETRPPRYRGQRQFVRCSASQHRLRSGTGFQFVRKTVATLGQGIAAIPVAEKYVDLCATGGWSRLGSAR
jgi:hypothetical protein